MHVVNECRPAYLCLPMQPNVRALLQTGDGGRISAVRTCTSLLLLLARLRWIAIVAMTDNSHSIAAATDDLMRYCACHLRGEFVAKSHR